MRVGRGIVFLIFAPVLLAACGVGSGGSGVTSSVPVRQDSLINEPGMLPHQLEKNPPGNWQWRGITVSSLDTHPDSVSLLKDRLGINSIKLFMDVRSYAIRNHLTPQEAWDQNLKWVSDMLEECKLQGVTAVVSSHEFPIDPSLGLTQDSPGFWQNQDLQNQVVDLVASLVSNLKDRGDELGAYEILSEPLVRDGDKVGVPQQWPSLLKRIVQEFRKQDPNRWIVATPGPGGLPQGYENYKPLDDPRIIYSAHLYQPHSFTHQGVQGRPLGYTYPGVVNNVYWDKQMLAKTLAPLKRFQETYNVPVWIGEFSTARWSTGGEKYLMDLIDLFNEYGWGWAYFNFGGYHGWHPDFDSGYATDESPDIRTHYVGEGSLRWQTLKTMFKR